MQNSYLDCNHNLIVGLRYACMYLRIYTESAKKMYTHFNIRYLCIVFEVELNYHYNM